MEQNKGGLQYLLFWFFRLLEECSQAYSHSYKNEEPNLEKKIFKNFEAYGSLGKNLNLQNSCIAGVSHSDVGGAVLLAQGLDFEGDAFSRYVPLHLQHSCGNIRTFVPFFARGNIYKILKIVLFTRPF